jgi:hypothetical protein
MKVCTCQCHVYYIHHLAYLIAHVHMYQDVEPWVTRMSIQYGLKRDQLSWFRGSKSHRCAMLIVSTSPTYNAALHHLMMSSSSASTSWPSSGIRYWDVKDSIWLPDSYPGQVTMRLYETEFRNFRLTYNLLFGPCVRLSVKFTELLTPHGSLSLDSESNVTILCEGKRDRGHVWEMYTLAGLHNFDRQRERLINGIVICVLYYPLSVARPQEEYAAPRPCM